MLLDDKGAFVRDIFQPNTHTITIANKVSATESARQQHVYAPGSDITGRSATNAAAAKGRITVWSSGLCNPDTSLASSLLQATPADVLYPAAFMISCRASSAIPLPTRSNSSHDAGPPRGVPRGGPDPLQGGSSAYAGVFVILLLGWSPVMHAPLA
jgi:hypothetical protein